MVSLSEYNAKMLTVFSDALNVADHDGVFHFFYLDAYFFRKWV